MIRESTDHLDAKARRQLRSLGVWLREANALIDGKIADAKAHMVVAVNETLKRTPDGRPTLAKASRSPSVLAAKARLDELWTALAGPSVRSLDGLIRDAREAFYREAFDEHRPLIPAELLVTPDPEPTVAGIRRCRGMILHGFDIRQEIAGPVARSKLTCTPAVSLAGRRASSNRDSSRVLADWHRRNLGAIRSVVRLALSDSQIAADVLAGRDLIHSDYLDDSPIGVGA